MQKSGGAVILMQKNSNSRKEQDILDSMEYFVGDAEIIRNMAVTPTRNPFDDEIVNFLNDVSRTLLGMREARAYPDVVTLAFWIRKASVLNLKKRFEKKDGDMHLGRGMVFHIAPSNVPVNYAYSLVSGLLTGNMNVVRLPSKDFDQVRIINRAIEESLSRFKHVKNYICLVRYERKREINDFLSAMSEVRMIWGGDRTIAELRKSPLMPRAGEIAFADRYSLAIIDSDVYLELDDKQKVAEGFYNDTYLMDQNACTSPCIVVWLGSRKEEAKKIFWEKLHRIVREKYSFQPIMGINKLTSSYLTAAAYPNVKIEDCQDNYLVRVKIPEIVDALMNWKDHSGYFLEYDCGEILELRTLCNDTHCQTIGFLGERETLFPLLESGIKGVDRVVPIGKTMDFDLIWDGYDLTERLTRTIHLDFSCCEKSSYLE